MKNKVYYKFMGKGILVFLFSVSLLLTIATALSGFSFISLSEVLKVWIGLYGLGLFTCIITSILFHRKAAILSETEVILYETECNPIKFSKKKENIYHIPYENICILDYETSQGISRQDPLNPSRLLVNTNDGAWYQVLAAPKILFYELGRRTNAKMQRSNTMRKNILMYLGIGLLYYLINLIS